MPVQKPCELRIAVAMRGGVSLAVWMGGACSEIVRLREARPGGDDPYAKLLEILGYDKVTVDVISGSSAGGLNGALLALHLAYGMPFGDGVRDLWLRLADLELLTRSPSAPHPDSLLIGDEGGFYSRLRHACRELLAQAPPRHPATPHIRLVLTATRLRPRPIRVHETLGEPLQADQARAYVQFQHRAVDGSDPIVSDFGRGEDVVRDVADRLSYAARTTSSFPGAFPPARIWVAGGETPPPGRDFRGLTSETGAGDHGGSSVELVDGGVLDNIPITWAIRAIAGAPANRPVDRWLVYLQPVEPRLLAPPPGTEPPAPMAEAPATTGRQRRVTRLVRLLLATVTRRMDSESLLDDAEELHDAAATARRVRGVAATGIPSDPAEVLDDPRRLAAYRQLVGLAEGARLARLIEDPASVLGPDPLPLPPHRPVVDSRAVAGLRDPDQVSPLAADDRIPEGIRTPLALGRTVSLLLDWVRAAEECGQLPAGEAGIARDRLFSARLAVELLMGHRERMVLPHLGTAPGTAGLIDLVRRATWRLTEAVAPGWRIPTADSWPTWYQQLVEVAAGPLPDSVTGWPATLFSPFWDELAAVGIGIGSALDPDVDGPPGFDVLRTASLPGNTAPAGVGGASPVAAMPAERLEKMRRALGAAELLLGPVRIDPFTEPTEVKFHAITASRRNRIEELIFGSMLEPGERARLKLSGNQLNNFAAFLSARWRHTDWTWGRLDAIPSLVELVLADRDRLTAQLDQLSDDAAVSRLRELYLSGGAGQTEALRHRWDRLGVHPGNVRERFTDVVIDRLQHGVLTEELPVLKRLESRGNNSDLPPRPEDLQELPPASLSDAPMIAEVGAQTVRSLLRRGHVQRAATRVGLVAWRAMQPAGTGLFAWLARRVFGVVKPVLLLPPLAAVAAPLGAVVATLGAWLLVSAVAGTWSSPLTLPVLTTGFALAAGAAAWRLLDSPRGWTVAASAAAGAGLCLVGSLALHLSGGNQVWNDEAVRYAAILLGALAGIAPFGWLRASGVPGARVLVIMFLLLLLAGILGVVLSGVPGSMPPAGMPGDGRSGWLSGPPLGLLTLYAVLMIPTVLLTWLLPDPPGRTSSAGNQ